VVGEPLSPRERDVVRLIAEYGAPEAARRLGISVHTVDMYRSRAYTKLGAHNQADAHLRLGWLRLPEGPR
jgi:DNA-binding CsgD family transcriptional regulator